MEEQQSDGRQPCRRTSIFRFPLKFPGDSTSRRLFRAEPAGFAVGAAAGGASPFLMRRPVRCASHPSGICLNQSQIALSL
jgi:hypothetical protein